MSIFRAIPVVKSMKLQDVAGFIDPKYKVPSVCESCGEEFTCGASIKGCWCMKVTLSDETREEMKKEFNDCLCPDCLAKLEEKQLEKARAN